MENLPSFPKTHKKQPSPALLIDKEVTDSVENPECPFLNNADYFQKKRNDTEREQGKQMIYYIDIRKFSRSKQGVKCIHDMTIIWFHNLE